MYFNGFPRKNKTNCIPKFQKKLLYKKICSINFDSPLKTPPKTGILTTTVSKTTELLTHEIKNNY